MKPSHIETLNERLSFLRRKITGLPPERAESGYVKAEISALESVLLYPYINFKVRLKHGSYVASAWIKVNHGKSGARADPVDAVLAALRPVIERHLQEFPPENADTTDDET